MGISYKYAKYISKLGIKLLIGLLVLDVLWALIRYLITNVTYGGELPPRFPIIDSITTNTIFIVIISLITTGMMILGIYYFKISKYSFHTSIVLIVIIAIKIAYIFYCFSQLFNESSEEIPLKEILSIIYGLLFIITFILFDVFQRHLKKSADIGYGKAVLPYIFGFFALIFPITNILFLTNIDINNGLLTFLHLFSYIAAIFEIILLFDLLRRFDSFRPLLNEDESRIIKLNIPEAQSKLKRKKREQAI